MPTPAKDRFMRHVSKTVRTIEYNCLLLSQDVPKFNDAYLTHNMTILNGMVHRICQYMIVNRGKLKKSLPKGVLKHGESRKKKGKQRKTQNT